MSEAIDQALALGKLEECVSSVFADMAFIDVERMPGAAEPGPEEGLERAGIDIMKPLSLRLELATSPGLRARIADILFGDASPRSRDDAFLELLNVIAGAFLTSYFGQGCEVKMELPHYLYSFDEPWGESVARARFDAEGEPLVIELRSVRYRY